MLPPGHLAGAFLVDKVAAIWIPDLGQAKYLWLTTFFGFLPDLDFFYAFTKSKSLKVDDNVNHHQFISHAPLVYAGFFLLWLVLFPASRLIAITFILGTWSHFLLDSIQGDGIRWLYPFNQKLYSLTKAPYLNSTKQKFFAYWWDFTKQYLRIPIAKLEILIIIAALAVLIFK